MRYGEDYRFGLAVLKQDWFFLGGHSYAYDGDGSRVAQTVGALTLRYTLDVQPGLTTVLAETTGAITTRYLHGPTGIHAQQNADGGWRWLLQDGLQSVRAVANGTDVVAAQQYSPYGVPFAPLPETDFGFTGELTDDNDLVYLRARYLNPAMGVFAGLDRFEGDEEMPLTLNGYGWVEGNTPNLTDPNGFASLIAGSCNVQSSIAPDLSNRCAEAAIPGFIPFLKFCGGGSRGGGAAGVGVPVVIVTERIARLLEAAKTVAETVIGAIRAIDLVIDLATGTAGARRGPLGGRAVEAPAIPQTRTELGESSKAQEQERDKSVPIPQNQEVETCKAKYPNSILCRDLPSSYTFSSPYAALSAIKSLAGNNRVSLHNPDVTKAGPCPGIGTHYNVRSGNRRIASIRCCPCCTEVPLLGPIMQQRCEINW